jgi:hypothetical protein
MKTDLNREQMMMIVERARYQRSIAAGDIIAAAPPQGAVWLAKVDRQVPASPADVADGAPLKRSDRRNSSDPRGGGEIRESHTRLSH